MDKAVKDWIGSHWTQSYTSKQFASYLWLKANCNARIFDSNVGFATKLPVLT